MALAKPRDPGLQVERTMLAWKRTALALLANGLLVLRAGMEGHPMLMASALVLCTMSVVLVFIGMRRSEQTRHHGRCRPAAVSILVTSALAVLASGVGGGTLLLIGAGR